MERPVKAPISPSQNTVVFDLFGTVGTGQKWCEVYAGGWRRHGLLGLSTPQGCTAEDWEMTMRYGGCPEMGPQSSSMLIHRIVHDKPHVFGIHLMYGKARIIWYTCGTGIHWDIIICEFGNKEQYDIIIYNHIHGSTNSLSPFRPKHPLRNRRRVLDPMNPRFIGPKQDPQPVCTCLKESGRSLLPAHFHAQFTECRWTSTVGIYVY